LIDGPVEGAHRNGTLTIEDARAVDLTLTGSRARLVRIADEVTVQSRGGDLFIRDTRGRLTIDPVNSDVTIAGAAGDVRVNGSGGRLEITDPGGAVQIDARRSDVTVALAAAVPLTVVANGGRVRVALGDAPVAIDAVATDGGRIDARAIGVDARADGDTMRVNVLMSGGDGAAAPVILRAAQGEIVIARR
jgi:hypothetical protein